MSLASLPRKVTCGSGCWWAWQSCCCWASCWPCGKVAVRRRPRKGEKHKHSESPEGSMSSTVPEAILSDDADGSAKDALRVLDELRAEPHVSEEQYRSLAEMLPGVAWTARPDGWIDYA